MWSMNISQVNNV